MDIVLLNGRVTTLDNANPQATAGGIKDGVFAAIGEQAEVMSLRAPGTKVIDFGERLAGLRAWKKQL